MAEIKDWFIAATSDAAALLGVINAYLNDQSADKIERLKTQIVQIGEERKFAADIMERYDNIISNPAVDREIRLSRLEGLKALAALIQHSKDDPGGIDTRPILIVIETQSKNYAGEIAALTVSATGAEADKLNGQYVRAAALTKDAGVALSRLNAAAPVTANAAPHPAATRAIDQTRFDIFWCSGTPQSAEALALANAISQLRPASSTRPWNIKAISVERNAVAGYGLRGQKLRFDVESERAVAQQFAQLAKNAGANFDLQLAGNLRTPGIVSAFICPG